MNKPSVNELMSQLFGPHRGRTPRSPQSDAWFAGYEEGGDEGLSLISRLDESPQEATFKDAEWAASHAALVGVGLGRTSSVAGEVPPSGRAQAENGWGSAGQCPATATLIAKTPASRDPVCRDAAAIPRQRDGDTPTGASAERPDPVGVS